MNRACLAVILVAAASPAASAGTYLGLGIGTAPALNDDNGTARHVVPSSRSGKVFAGMRFGQISVEGGIGGFSLLQQDQRPGQTALLPFGSAYQASLSLKGSHRSAPRSRESSEREGRPRRRDAR